MERMEQFPTPEESPSDDAERSVEERLADPQRETEDVKRRAIQKGELVYDQDGHFEYAIAPNGERSILNKKQWVEVRTSNFKEWYGDWERYRQLAAQSERSADEQAELDALQLTVSKIADQNGEPAVVYHGSASRFQEFIEHWNPKRGAAGRGWKGHYFADEKEKVLDYAGLSKMSGEEDEPIYEIHRRDALRIAEMFKQKYQKTLFFWMKREYLDLYKAWRRSARRIEPTIYPSYLRSVNPKVIDNGVPGRGGNWNSFESDVLDAQERGHDAVVWHNTYDGGPRGTVLNVFAGDQIKSAENNNGLFEPAGKNIES